ncbi:MAG TPA: competence protein CoiA family protein, partial [Mucilaginibacter sp.]|nr:competence protein CoiA family protein [Mucilaginibacter sp.]
MIRYALVDGQLREPVTGMKGICPGCDKSLIAKCGPIKIHHWAHKQHIDCDPWWEQMTQWHLDWQNNFAPACREVIFRDEQSGEFHRADIHTAQAITIEFQHSSLSLDELESRNKFYKELIWVVNAQPFKNQFILGIQIPNPHSPLLARYNFSVNINGSANFLQFYLKEEYRGQDPRRWMRMYSLNDPELELVADEYYENPGRYYLFEWKYKRLAWLKSDAPVFLDLGDQFLYWI